LPCLMLGLAGGYSSSASAQASTTGTANAAEPARWRVSGEVGAVLGGRWLAGGDSPRVSTDPGLSLSVALQRETSGRASIGLSLRGAMQPISMDEAGMQWSGGTATDAQLLGTVGYAIRRSGQLLADVEAGGGIAFIAGTRTVYPFTEISRFSPVGEAGIALSLGEVGESLYRYRPFALVVRYGVLRVDAFGGDVGQPNSMKTGAGWVGRTTIALRYRP
jgi:hypothetical protein